MMKGYKQSQSLLTILVCVRLDAHLCLTLCDPMDYSSPGSSVHGIFQVRIPPFEIILDSLEVAKKVQKVPVYASPRFLQ